MRVNAIEPVPHERHRYLVTLDPGGLPWLVDLSPGPGLPQCACAIEHSRTPGRWHCKHVRAVREFLKMACD